jgi:hypothetical protein
MKTIFMSPILAVIFLAGCQSQKMSKVEAEFSCKWKAASPSERRYMIEFEGGNASEIANGYLIGKDRDTVVDFFGTPASETPNSSILYRTIGAEKIVVLFDENQKVRWCLLLK